MRKVTSFELKQSRLPLGLRGRFVSVLASEYVPHWDGPELPGRWLICAVHIHADGSDEGNSLWFFLPDYLPQSDQLREICQKNVKACVDLISSGDTSLIEKQLWTSHLLEVDGERG